MTINVEHLLSGIHAVLAAEPSEALELAANAVCKFGVTVNEEAAAEQVVQVCGKRLASNLLNDLLPVYDGMTDTVSDDQATAINALFDAICKRYPDVMEQAHG